jgi:hypothetical protein
MSDFSELYYGGCTRKALYIPDIPALDRKESHTYFLQHDLLQQLHKIAKEYSIPGLIDACKTERMRTFPVLIDQAFLSLSVEKSYTMEPVSDY